MNRARGPVDPRRAERDGASLAADWVTISQSELAAMAADREMSETFGAFLATWFGGPKQSDAGSSPPPPPPVHQYPGPMRRRGPRPLPLHLLLAGSPAGSRDPTWSPPADAPAADARLVAGIAAYRRHSWTRDLPEPECVWQEGGSRLLDYGGQGATAIFVPSLINRAHILDLARGRSLMRWLSERGIRALLLDWGWPGELERSFTLTDYIAGRLERAVAATPGKVTLAGYCMGGLLTLAAVLRRPERVAGVALLATPWDFHAAAERTAAAMTAWMPALEPVLAAHGSLPVDVLQGLFALADGVGVADRYRGFAAIDPDTERARLFVALEDWLNDGVPLAAPVARECLSGWYGGNSPARGAWRVAGQAVQPEQLRCPVFLAVPTRDRVVPPPSARALAARIPQAAVHDAAAGHIGMIAGSGAEAGLWTELLRWLRSL